MPPLLNYGFGARVAIEGNTVVVGSSAETISAFLLPGWPFRGASVFERDSNTGRWSSPVKLIPHDYHQISVEDYGKRVSVSGERVMVAAEDFIKAAYIFQRVDAQQHSD